MNKIRSAVLLLLLAFPFLSALAQSGNQPLAAQANRPGDRQTQPSESLTSEQVAVVKSILSKYKESSLTAADARAINAAFREAGLRNGPGLQLAIRAAGFKPERLGALAPPPARAGEPPSQAAAKPSADRSRRGAGTGYSIEQATSDRAQLSTIAFDGLAFLTGTMGCNTFLPPGKVADFSGFQYMRDVDINQLGHNTSFVPRAANSVLFILTAAQRAQLVALALEQEKLLTEFAYQRFPLIQAFSRQLEGKLPAGSDGLRREAVMKYTAKLYAIDGQLSYRRAQVVGGTIRSLTAPQREYLSKLAFADSSTWPELPDQLDQQGLSHTAHVAVMTYASEMLSWYAGSVEADVYFCPERHATYFGSFYMKDIPAMGNSNYSISTALTGDSGEAFLAALTETQRKLVSGLVNRQRSDLAEIVATRRAIATELRRFMKEASIDRDKVLALSQRYGELDGEISYYYATAFAQVARTLTPERKQTLLKLRNLDAKYACHGAYLYSQPIAMPAIPDTDFLFGKAKTSSAPPAATAIPASEAKTSFTLRSSAVEDGGTLPVQFTGDGAGDTLPLEWSHAPAGTRSYALVMHHVAPDRTKWYWVLYNLPAGTSSLPQNVKDVGTAGNNSVNGRTEYAPPHSKGPGPKTYVYTIYALSAPVQLAVKPSEVSRDVLLAAMHDSVLATAQLRVVYSRPDGTGGKSEPLGGPRLR